jgi:outer membrane lipoprotein SlyB
VKLKSGILAFMLFSISSFTAADTLILRDGTTRSGTLVSATSTTITFREGKTLHRYARSKVQSLQFGDNTATSSTTTKALTTKATTAATTRQPVILPAGTEIVVLTNQNIDSTTASEGQVFSADVAEPVADDSGQVVIPKGSPAELIISKVSAGNVTGGSELSLDLQSVKVGSHRYVVSTQDVQQQGAAGIGANKRTAAMVGGGAALGTLIGAVAGGGKGAAVGALAGAAAGTGAEVLTKGKAVQVPAESKLRFRLDQPLRLDQAY